MTNESLQVGNAAAFGDPAKKGGAEWCVLSDIFQRICESRGV